MQQLILWIYLTDLSDSESQRERFEYPYIILVVNFVPCIQKNLRLYWLIVEKIVKVNKE